MIFSRLVVLGLCIHGALWLSLGIASVLTRPNDVTGCSKAAHWITFLIDIHTPVICGIAIVIAKYTKFQVALAHLLLSDYAISTLAYYVLYGGARTNAVPLFILLLLPTILANPEIDNYMNRQWWISMLTIIALIVLLIYEFIQPFATSCQVSLWRTLLHAMEFPSILWLTTMKNNSSPTAPEPINTTEKNKSSYIQPLLMDVIQAATYAALCSNTGQKLKGAMVSVDFLLSGIRHDWSNEETAVLTLHKCCSLAIELFDMKTVVTGKGIGIELPFQWDATGAFNRPVSFPYRLVLTLLNIFESCSSQPNQGPLNLQMSARDSGEVTILEIHTPGKPHPLGLDSRAFLDSVGGSVLSTELSWNVVVPHQLTRVDTFIPHQYLPPMCSRIVVTLVGRTLPGVHEAITATGCQVTTSDNHHSTVNVIILQLTRPPIDEEKTILTQLRSRNPDIKLLLVCTAESATEEFKVLPDAIFLMPLNKHYLQVQILMWFGHISDIADHMGKSKSMYIDTTQDLDASRFPDNGSASSNRSAASHRSNGSVRSAGGRSVCSGRSVVSASSVSSKGSACSRASLNSSISVGRKNITLHKRESGPVRWKRGECLGAGGFGVVHVGLDEISGELFAVKTITVEVGDSKLAEKLSMLQTEIAMLKQLRHDNVVGYIGVSREGTAVNIFMEYVAGGSISTLLRQFGPLQEDVIAVYTQQMLMGLAYLHQNRVVHRDIKGGNTLVGIDGTVKLADFGAAFLKQEGKLEGDGMKGTPHWMSPEVLKGEGATFAADIWSLSCTVIEMLTAGPPFHHAGLNFLALSRLLSDENSKLPLPACSAIMMDFINAGLQRDPNLRPSADNLLSHRLFNTVKPTEAADLRAMIQDHADWMDFISSLVNGESLIYEFEQWRSQRDSQPDTPEGSSQPQKLPTPVHKNIEVAAPFQPAVVPPPAVNVNGPSTPRKLEVQATTQRNAQMQQFLVQRYRAVTQSVNPQNQAACRIQRWWKKRRATIRRQGKRPSRATLRIPPNLGIKQPTTPKSSSKGNLSLSVPDINIAPKSPRSPKSPGGPFNPLLPDKGKSKSAIRRKATKVEKPEKVNDSCKEIPLFNIMVNGEETDTHELDLDNVP